jgi:hypothetical protein
VNTEDRLRAAAHARADLVRDIRALQLPDEAAGRARRVVRSWGGWLVPVAAAAMVVVLALTLVAVRHTATPAATAAPPVPAASPLPAAPAAVRAKIPQYYAVISPDTGSDRDFQGNPARDFTIVDDRAGRVVYSFQAPGAGYLDSVSASDDDKTFILTVKDNSGGVHWTVDKIHLSAHPGGKPTFSLNTIPVTGVDNAQHLDTYLSPGGGSEISVVAQQVTGTTVRTTVQSYHAIQSASPDPQPLRTWTTTRPGAASTGFFQANGVESVLFSSPAPSAGGSASPAYSQVRALDTTSPSGDLIARSRVLFSGPASCAAAMVINNGLTAVCGTRVTAAAGQPGTACAHGGLNLSAYAIRTQDKALALASYRYPCDAGTAVPLWATTGVKDVVAQLTVTSGRSAQTMLAVAAGGQLYGLPLPVTPVSGGTAIAF